ncbi:hypothetical protein [Pseudoclavibacter sp. VKM Ac-2888]|uniref:AraC-like ligand-binding domain-containing protein n=1 Tax=Pseudoclavibacter sp. VKM Ac-2888 TaxID=2783830 RepID=UPI00188D492C|nr:hypothetical protein [Pseudoclavibacter sp. VKM Ac-2888]MBF4552368.1 hypothetical protein [Pseudoclavibacter sp. VKM Ac-2888]
MNYPAGDRSQRSHQAGRVRVRVIHPGAHAVRLEGPAGELTDEVVLLISRTGSVASSQGTRSTTLDPLDATFVLNSAPHTHRLQADSILHCFTIPREQLMPASTDAGRLSTSRAGSRTPLQHSAAAFLTAYCDSLLAGSDAHPQDEATLVRLAAVLILGDNDDRDQDPQR